jgi:hypothetical protein
MSGMDEKRDERAGQGESGVRITPERYLICVTGG